MFSKIIQPLSLHKLYATVFALLLCCFVKTYSQDASGDRKALYKEYVRVMAYKNKPTLYYESLTKDKASFLENKNKDAVKNMYYRDKDIVYSREGDAELYLKDGQLFSIDNINKTISVVAADQSMIAVLKPTCEAPPPEDPDPIPGGGGGGRNNVTGQTNKNNFEIDRRLLNDSIAQLSLQWYQVDSLSMNKYTTSVNYYRKTLLPMYISTRLVTSPVKKKQELKTGNLLEKDDPINDLPGMKSDDVIISSATYFQHITEQADNKKFVSAFDESLAFDARTNTVSGKGKYKEYKIISQVK